MRTKSGFLILVVALVTMAFIGMTSTYLMALFWTLVLTIIFYPLYCNMRSWLRGRENIASFLTLLIILVGVIFPILGVVLAVIRQSRDFYQRIRNQEVDIDAVLAQLQGYLQQLDSFLGIAGIQMDDVKTSIRDGVVNGVQLLANETVVATQNTIVFFIQFSLMLYLLFFFLKDGEKIMDNVVKAIPLRSELQIKLYKRFAGVVNATVKGTLTIAIIQGTIGGLLFWALRIEGALIWGVLMTILALIPALGTSLVWGPAAIILFIQGEVTDAIIMVVVGMLLIGLVDNLLRPYLVGKDARMPDYLVLLATLGGLAVFGLSGFVLGPVMASLFLVCWEIVGREFA
jgi:predicted PurR-regulated permease PerM